MLNLNGIYGATANIGFRSKGELVNKPSYFTVGGFEIPVDTGFGKTYDFHFDWVQSNGSATLMEDGTYEMDFTLRELDLDFICDSFTCKKDLDLMDIFRSIETVKMSEIYYGWDKVLEDGTIEEDAGHFFDVTHFEIDVFYMEDGEEKTKTFKAPQELLDAYNEEEDKRWDRYDNLMNNYCINPEFETVLIQQ